MIEEYDKYWKLVKRIVNRMVYYPQLRDDIEQEAWVAILRNKHKYKGLIPVSHIVTLTKMAIRDWFKYKNDMIHVPVTQVNRTFNQVYENWDNIAIQHRGESEVNSKILMESFVDKTMGQPWETWDISFKEFARKHELTDREQTIVILKVANYTLKEIGSIIGVSPERVRQIIIGIRSKING